MASKFQSKITKEGDVEYSTEKWNVADAFMKLKVLRLLILLDKYETMSQYGVEELGEEIYFSQNDIARRRKDALYRFCSTIKQLLGNVKFAIKKRDSSQMTDIQKRIMNVEQYLPDTITSKQDMVKKEVELRINEEHFNTCFDILQKIKEETNILLDKSGLIFKENDEVDLDTMMQEIIEGG
jgi:hypothetical protein